MLDSPTLHEWLHALLRWFHVVTGIMWIGQTYLFNWMEKTMRAEADASLPPNTVGNLWMVHGGGFYLVEKQRSPVLMPRTLHWFKWESAFTWLSGLLLLLLVYYFGGLLIDESSSRLSHAQAMAVGLGLLIVAWFVYDTLWMSPLGKNEAVASTICFVLLLGIIYGLTHLFSGRAAYIHVGAMFGTIMFVNVWRRILPGQQKMLDARKAGKEPDLSFGAQGARRSKHNTYMSVSLVFIMLSNHFPVAVYGSEYNWIVLPVIVLVGFVVAKLLRG
jgi:uncharacterized membrane protein